MDLAMKDRHPTLRAIIETPQGSRNKLKFDHELGRFRISRSLPAGMSFPFDFGYFPGTLADDGDALDVLIIMDGPGYPGVVVDVRLLGVIEAEVKKGGQVIRNDRLIAVADGTTERGTLRRLADIEDALRDQICSWFETDSRLAGKSFRLLSQGGPGAAAKLLANAQARAATGWLATATSGVDENAARLDDGH